MELTLVLIASVLFAIVLIALAIEVLGVKKGVDETYRLNKTRIMAKGIRCGVDIRELRERRT